MVREVEVRVGGELPVVLQVLPPAWAWVWMMNLLVLIGLELGRTLTPMLPCLCLMMAIERHSGAETMLPIAMPIVPILPPC